VSSASVPLHQRAYQQTTVRPTANSLSSFACQGGAAPRGLQAPRGGAAGGRGRGCGVRGYLVCHISNQRPRLFQHLRYRRRCRASSPTSGLPIYVLAKHPPTVNNATLTSANADPLISADPRLASLFWYKRRTFTNARHETTPPPPLRAPAPPSLQHFVWLLLCLTWLCASRHCGGCCSLRSHRTSRRGPQNQAAGVQGMRCFGGQWTETPARQPNHKLEY